MRGNWFALTLHPNSILMPELPDLAVMAKNLHRGLVGKTVQSLELHVTKKMLFWNGSSTSLIVQAVKTLS